MVIKQLCNCGNAFEYSEHAPLEACTVCRLKTDSELADRMGDIFDLEAYLETSEGIKLDMKEEDPVGYQEMVVAIEEDKEPSDEEIGIPDFEHDVNVEPIAQIKDDNLTSSEKRQLKAEEIVTLLGSEGEWKKQSEIGKKVKSGYGLAQGTYHNVLKELIEQGHVSKKKEERSIWLKSNGTYTGGPIEKIGKLYGKNVIVGKAPEKVEIETPPEIPVEKMVDEVMDKVAPEPVDQVQAGAAKIQTGARRGHGH